MAWARSFGGAALFMAPCWLLVGVPELWAGVALAALAMRALLVWRGVRSPSGVTLLAVAGLALGVIAADAAARLVYSPPTARIVSPRFERLSRMSPQGIHWPEVRGDLAAMSGDLSWPVRRFQVAIDERGFRNLPGRATRPNEVVVLGDSIAYGQAVSQELTFSSLLETRFGHLTYNLGIAGSPWHQLLNFTLAAGEVETVPRPWLVWSLFGANDLDEHYGEGDEPTPIGALESASIRIRTLQNLSPVGRTLRRIRRPARTPVPSVSRVSFQGRAMLLFDTYSRRAGRTLQDVLDHPRRRRLEEVFETLVERARRRGYRVLVVNAPWKELVYRPASPSPGDEAAPGLSAFGRFVQSLCERRDVGFLDLEVPFAARSGDPGDGGELLWWPDDSHWNARGHALAAEMIARELAGPGRRRTGTDSLER